jgi:dynein light chain roadblock-type
MSEVEDTITRIKTHKSVQGLVIVNHEGRVIRSTFSTERKEEGENIAKSIP